MDWKEVAKESTGEVLNELKEEGVQILKEQVLPGVIAAKDDFVAELKTEATASGSAWVKIRNAAIVVLIGVVGKVASKAIDKITEKENTVEA